MSQIWRVTVTWTGGRIGTGFTNMFFTASVGTQQQAADSVRAFFSSCYSVGAFLPTGVSLAFPSVVDTLEATNGQLTSNTTVTPAAAINGSGTARYPALAGACATWRTGDFVAGRRVRGRTFLVPADGQAFQADGTLDDTFRGFITTAGATLISAAPEFVIWRRPTSSAAADGSSHVVGAVTVNDQASFLTSRR